MTPQLYLDIMSAACNKEKNKDFTLRESGSKYLQYPNCKVNWQ